MMRPRRIYVGADLERLFADYLTHLACRAAGLGHSGVAGLAAAGQPGPAAAAGRDPRGHGPRQGRGAEEEGHRPGRGGRRTGSGTAMPRLCCWPGRRSGWYPAAWATPMCRPPWTCMAGSGRTRRCGRRRTGQSYASSWQVPVTGERPGLLRPAGARIRSGRLWRELPELWRGPVIGPGIEGWEDHRERRAADRPDRAAGPDPRRAGVDGALAGRGRHPVLGAGDEPARQHLAPGDPGSRPFPPSISAMDWDAAAALQGWFYATRWGRLPPHEARARLRVIFRFARPR